MIKNMALFLSAPFIGLVYAVLLPFVGLGMLAWFAARAFYESGKAHAALRAGKRMLLWMTAFVAGVVYVVAACVARFATLIWVGLRGREARPAVGE